MSTQSFFPASVNREIESAATSRDVTSRLSHVELAVLHLEASGEAPGDAGRCRQMIEAAVLARIAFAAEEGGE